MLKHFNKLNKKCLFSRMSTNILHKNLINAASMANWNDGYLPASSKMFRNNNRYRVNFNDYSTAFLMPPPPPPPPNPVKVNCGELRDHHRGLLVEITGRVNRQRVGKFIEIKDQYGVIQLVATDDKPVITKRFLNMPLESMITCVGYVHQRPYSSINNSMQTGGVEVHVEEIYNVKTPMIKRISGHKRLFSTMSQYSRCITSIEYKKSKTENVAKYFENRSITCGDLRLNDVNKDVQLVGWVYPKKNGKFLQLHDGYGSTQIVVNLEDSVMKNHVDILTENDVILVKGKVMARPKCNQNTKCETGEIELFVNDFKILNPLDIYEGPEKNITITPNNTELDSKINEVIIDNNNPEFSKYTERSHNCGELREKNIGDNVVLCGWLEYQRMRKFFTLRDSYGRIQIVIPENLESLYQMELIPYESIIKVEGKVTGRPIGMQNDLMTTGNIEVILAKLEVLNLAKSQLPILVRDFNRSKEALRMEYRYIDLRFPDMQHNLRLRSNMLMKMREYLINNSGFVEVETPTLFRRTPGGAQEFVVPTRKKGHFYSLVQSPQQFKQMLMVGGIDRYFQIARCYRDETTRPDRQPEFTQLDIELSFSNRENIMSMIEDTLKYCWPSGCGNVDKPFSKITYDEAMEKYGCDKPDTRFGLLLKNITNTLSVNNELNKHSNDFGAYAIVIKKPNSLITSAQKNSLLQLTKSISNVKLVIHRIKESTIEQWSESNLSKLLSKDVLLNLGKDLALEQDDLLLLAFGSKYSSQTAMGKVRLSMVEYLETNQLIPKRSKNLLNFLWVIDFPMFVKNNDNPSIIESTHHPFTSPHHDDLHLFTNLNENLLNIRSLAYDLVLNGQEIGGGSIRIHDSKLQKMILNDVLKINSDHLKHMLDALESGCPPHGGIALGIDRLISIICNTNSIRDVIAFPKSYDGKDPLSKAPVPISDEELNLYHLIIDNNEQKNNNCSIIEDSKKQQMDTAAIVT